MRDDKKSNVGRSHCIDTNRQDHFGKWNQHGVRRNKSGNNSGDAYMQASRGYEIATEELGEGNPNWLAMGSNIQMLFGQLA